MISKFLRSNDGQTAWLSPIIAVVLVVALFFVYNIGEYYYMYVREQNAIDAATYSGAAMQADSLNVIVKINKILLIAYTGFVVICAACIAFATLTGIWIHVPGCCGGAGAAMNAAEKIALATSTMLNKGSIAFSVAAMAIYKKSGGIGSFPEAGVFVTTLKLNRIYHGWFVRPIGYPPFLLPMNTFVGMAEKKRKNIYDWAIGKKKKPHVYGSFGQPRGGTSGGRYDKKGPYAIGWARVKYTPALSWFKKYQRHLYLAAKARPYGGNVHTMRLLSLRPWGHESFKAKLVPIKY